MLTDAQIRAHYLNPKVMNTIIRVATADDYSRAGAKYTEYTNKEGVKKSLTDWYLGSGAYPHRNTIRKINLSYRPDYVNTVGFRRTIYWTLNVFDKDIYTLDYRDIDNEEGKVRSAVHTRAYTFGIDIDAGHGYDIHDPDVKRAVESLAQFYSDEFRKYLPNSVYLLYSGGGIYVMVHHKALESYFEQYQKDEDWLVRLQALYDALNCLIDALRDKFFELHPEFKEKVKPDAINNVQRIFKCIFSVHKKYDYAVIPLDPEKVWIDFTKAGLPLNAEVLKDSENWYTKFDDGSEFIDKMLKPYLGVAHEKVKKQRNTIMKLSEILAPTIPIEDLSLWAPCMRNLYNLPTCGEGQTRALAAFASFLGQIGIEENKAKSMFDELVDRWGARQENIFRDYFKRMKVATCARIRENNNTGFPKGVSLRILNVCKPDGRCLNISSPRYYTDIVANKALLLTRIKEEEAGSLPA